MNEALAKEVERNVRRREEISSTAEELTAPQNLKDTPIPPDSDSKKTCHEGIDSSCEQWQLTDGRWPCSCRDADTVNFDDSPEWKRETNT